MFIPEIRLSIFCSSNISLKHNSKYFLFLLISFPNDTIAFKGDDSFNSSSIFDKDISTTSSLGKHLGNFPISLFMILFFVNDFVYFNINSIMALRAIFSGVFVCFKLLLASSNNLYKLFFFSPFFMEINAVKLLEYSLKMF